jgi:hypothetical protein
MHGVQRGNRQKMQKETFQVASVDEVDAEEMQNQTTKDIIRKCSACVLAIPYTRYESGVCRRVPFV